MRVLLLPAPPYHPAALSHYLRAVLNVVLALMRSVVLLHPTIFSVVAMVAVIVDDLAFVIIVS